MKIVVGLGNPGKEYEKTRHNVGFMVVDSIFNYKFKILNQFLNAQFEMNKKLGAEVVKLGEILLVKPQKFMNNSGEVVQKVIHYFLEKPEARSTKHEYLWVVHDDLDIKLGEYKIQFGRGPKVHNGVNSVEQALGTNDFWRVRVGIENRATGDRFQVTGQDYVLKPFLADEIEIVESVVKKVTEEVCGRIV
jgi:PTH1 family peptidyl-tRNA hydrolase